MKKHIIIFAAIVFSAATIPACNSRASKAEKFMGEWKRIDKPDSNDIVIKKENDAIILTKAKDTVVGMYKPDRDVITFYFLNISTYNLKFNEKTGHVFLDHNEGEFKKVN